MSLDLLFPFGVLLALVIYLIFTRNAFEGRMLKHYEDKFDEWKMHNKAAPSKDTPKELVALLYKKNYKYELEVFKKEELELLNISKFNIKELT